MTMTNSTISGNAAGARGGGMRVSASPTVVNSTITGNSARTDGGGIRVVAAAYPATIKHSIIAGNTRGALLVPNDVTGGAALAFSLLGVDTGATITDNGGNLVGAAEAPLDPLIGPLADNGGPTRTHALLPGSPAIDAGDTDTEAGMNGTPEFDQRGMPRSRIANGDGAGGARIDIGAFERQPGETFTLVVDTLADETDGDYSPGDFSLREALAIANLNPGSDTIRFSPSLLMQASPLPASSLQCVVIGLTRAACSRAPRDNAAPSRLALHLPTRQKSYRHRSASQDLSRSGALGQTSNRLRFSPATTSHRRCLRPALLEA
jgi:hypothetical protein